MARITTVNAAIHTNSDTIVSAKAFPPVPGRPGFTSIDLGPSVSIFISDEGTAAALIAAAQAALDNARIWAEDRAPLAFGDSTE